VNHQLSTVHSQLGSSLGFWRKLVKREAMIQACFVGGAGQVIGTFLPRQFRDSKIDFCRERIRSFKVLAADRSSFSAAGKIG
jgi:hypothetical protein